MEDDETERMEKAISNSSFSALLCLNEWIGWKEIYISLSALEANTYLSSDRVYQILCMLYRVELNHSYAMFWNMKIIILKKTNNPKLYYNCEQL
jgi:hypothetical protein